MTELDMIKIFVHMHYGQKIGKNYSRLGSNCQLLKFPEKENFQCGNTYIFSNDFFIQYKSLQR